MKLQKETNALINFLEVFIMKQIVPINVAFKFHYSQQIKGAI